MCQKKNVNLKGRAAEEQSTECKTKAINQCSVKNPFKSIFSNTLFLLLRLVFSLLGIMQYYRRIQNKNIAQICN